MGSVLGAFSSAEGNGFLSIAHLSAGSAMLAFGFLFNDQARVTLQVPKIVFNQTSSTVYSYYEDAWEVNLYFFNAVFLVFTGIVHFRYAMDHLFEKTRLAQKRRDRRTRDKHKLFFVPKSFWWRFIEYSLSAPTMLVIIAILSGVRDIYSLVLLFGCMASTMFFGYIVDVSWYYNYHMVFPVSPFWFGFVPYVSCWGPVIANFILALNGSIVKPPQFVYYIIWILFAFFSSFAMVQWWFIVRVGANTVDYALVKTVDDSESQEYDNDFKSTRDFIENYVPTSAKLATLKQYDGAYNVLSFLAKFTLALLVYLGFSNTI